ncbi:Response regulator containing CheY-like receiver domain and AraC-type DNA-binding domain [Paenibacillus sp. UNC496MF]|uniref:response regulator n=1 Tax=Paenibacillus sp. UNC496MF TaxID=1502753 RepID=UPI0008E3B95D|nr:response regulator [Paenibacillus sp. UNC496MF]SFI48306.1 Response regulator containing CheY-like receiver domain and AraC-type DNA-binding domain [Paenibacillus sp. UNC496MF]
MEMNVFVVDDEERQRRSIVKHTAWERYRMRVTGEWESADEALADARQRQPDLLITDIRLLGTDGLELASRMRTINPRMRIVMVTGYEEFRYAKTALDIGVDAFLVKPILFDELHAVLDRIYQEERAKRLTTRETTEMKEQLDAFKPIAQEQFVQELLHGLVVGEAAARSRADALGLFAAEGPRCAATIVVQGDRASSLPMEERLRRERSRLERAAQAACGSLLELRTTSQRGNIVLILQGGEAGEFERDTMRCVLRIGEEIERLGIDNARIGIGPPAAKLGQLSESFRLAQRAVNLRLIGCDERVYSWKMLMEQGAGLAKSLEELTDDFYEMLGAGDSQNSLTLLGELLNCLAAHVHMQGTELRSYCMRLISGAYRAASEIGEAHRRFGSERKLWEQLLECREEPELLQETVRILRDVSQFIAERKKSHAQVVVQKAIAYMNERFHENLSLRSVAESVFLSPGYLGALFRTELGTSFTDQLIRIRIQRAKDMLLRPELKLYEVAERAGYQNIGYFTGLFKRVTGYSPKEYRDFHGYTQAE